MGRTRRYALRSLALAALIALVIAWRPMSERLEAAALLLRLEAPPAEPPDGLASFRARDVVEERTTFPGPSEQPVRAWRFRPRSEEGAPGLVLVHGVHRDGIDDLRMRHLGRNLARAGFDVLMPDLPSLRAYRVEPAALDVIAAAARYLADMIRQPKVALCGVSFGGGLALTVAGEQTLGERVGLVISIGGHHDLGRVMRASLASPDPYPRFVLAHRFADDVFPAEDIDDARAALERLLRGDKGGADDLAARLSEEGRRALSSALSGTEESAQRLADIVRKRAPELDRVSPRGRLAGVRIPVFVVHGRRDDIIPTTESARIAEELPSAHVLVTPLLSHVALDADPALGEWWEAVEWTRGWLGAARALGDRG